MCVVGLSARTALLGLSGGRGERLARSPVPKQLTAATESDGASLVQQNWTLILRFLENARTVYKDC